MSFEEALRLPLHRASGETTELCRCFGIFRVEFGNVCERNLRSACYVDQQQKPDAGKRRSPHFPTRLKGGLSGTHPGLRPPLPRTCDANYIARHRPPITPLRRAYLRQGARSAGFQPASGQDGRSPRQPRASGPRRGPPDRAAREAHTTICSTRPKEGILRGTLMALNDPVPRADLHLNRPGQASDRRDVGRRSLSEKNSTKLPSWS